MSLYSTLRIANRTVRRLLKSATLNPRAIRNYAKLLEENATLRTALKPTVDDLVSLVAARAPDPRALSQDGMTNIPLKAIAINATQQAGKQKLPHWRQAEPPVISIVIGTCQQLPLLQKAIDSIRKSNISVPHEIVVIDGGSRDGTVQWLVKQTDILTIAHRSREGLMSIAFRASHGRYVLMMNDASEIDAGLARLADLARSGSTDLRAEALVPLRTA